MATAASSCLASSVEKTNGAKLLRLLIDGGTTVLRNVFDRYHPPAQLAADLNSNYSILNNLLHRRILNRQQWDKLFPPGIASPDSSTFDITLLFLLLTNICGLTPPPSGWHAIPPESDTSLEANLVRVKFYRNAVYGHMNTTALDKLTFSTLWTEISAVLVRLGLDQAEVDGLKAEKSEEEDSFHFLIEGVNREGDIKSQMKNIHQTQTKSQQAVEDVPQSQTKTKKTVEEVFHAKKEPQQEVEDLRHVVETLRKERDKDIPFGATMRELNGSDAPHQDWEELGRQTSAPSEILARGPLATEAYQTALLEGEGYSRRVPVMIIGQDRTGKTSLKRSLKGQFIDSCEVSTDGIQMDPSYFKVSTDVWKIGKINEDTEAEPAFLFDYQAAQSILKSLKKEIPDHSRNTSGGGTEPSKVIKKTIELSDKPNSIMTEKPSSEGMDTSLQDSQDHLRRANIPDDIAALVQKLLENNQEVESEDDIFSTVWDFGGQSVYYGTHPIFLTKKAIYILTCDLSRDPYQTDNAEDTCCSKTPFDYLDFWMSSVYSLVNPEFEGSPPVFLVCTHADVPYRSVDPGSLAREVYDVLKKKAYGKLLKGFFVVDNTKSGSKRECQGVIKLRNKVLSVAKKLPQMNEPIPLKWLKFEKVLRLLSAEGHNWIPIEEARKISSNECGINDDKQFSTLLDFLHDQRVLIHFNETVELKNMVILSPQWLIDVFKEVITVKSWDQVEVNVEELWRDLEKNGILDEKLLDHVWRPSFDDGETCESLIAIMERFSLLCSWPSDGTTKKYLVPSMLKSPPTDDVRKFLASVKTPSLFVRFGSGRVPAGLFSRIILLFHQWCQDEVKCPVKPKLYDNFALFHISPLHATSVTLLCHSSSIEIVFNDGVVASAQETGFDDERNLIARRDIHRKLILLLESVREKFFWLKHMRYEMCVSCPVCSLQGEGSKCRKHKVRGCDCLHLLSEQELQKGYCEKEDIVCADIRIHKEIFVHWFAISDECDSPICVIQQEDITAPNQSGNPCAVSAIAPSEIHARGPLAIKAYRTALLEGKGYSRRVPVMIIGQDETGKTSLKRSLRGKPFIRGKRSTKGIKTDPSYFKVSIDVWRTGKISGDTEPEPTFSFEYQTAQSVFKTIKKEIPDDLSWNPRGSGTEPSKPHQSRSNKQQEAQLTPDSFKKGNTDNSNTEELSRNPSNSRTEPSKVMKKTTTERSPQDPELVENARADLKPSEEPSTSLQDSQDHLRGPNLPDDIAALVQRLLENNKEDTNEDDIYSIIWDFGGQSVYYVTHPIFLTKRAIYILTCDLSRDLYQTDNAPNKSSMRGNVEDTCCSKTPLDYLDFWMSSVYSLVSPEFSDSPPVFLVCTHADAPYRSVDSEALAREVYDVLKKKAYGKLLKGFFVVDNTKSGNKSECQGVIKLRNKVLSIAKKLPQMNEPIPLKWLKFEKVLRLLSKEGYKWIPIEEARKISSDECGINDDKHFSTLLDFLHDQRIVIHFNETVELKNMVILSPQWLIDVFKEVITVKSWEQVEENFEELWCDLEEKGILDEKLLDHVWRPLFDGREDCESLIAIMERFSLLCSWPSDGTTKKYLVPSMLKSPRTGDVIELLASVKTPSLFVRFGSGRVPAGLFSRLVLLFYQLYPTKPQLFANFALFRICPRYATSVILLCHSSSIEIIFRVGDVASGRETGFNNESNLNASRDIHQQLKLFLEGMRERFFWLKHMRYEMCVSCPVCSLQEGGSECRKHKVRGCDCLHLLSERELLKGYCEEDSDIVRADISICKEMFVAWFAFSDEYESRISPSQQEDITGRNQSEKHCAVSARVKEGCPTYDDLEDLSEHISNNWRKLGRRLDFHEAKLDGFADQKGTTADKAYAMLKVWKQRGASNATYSVLYEALCHKRVQRRDLAEEFCCW